MTTSEPTPTAATTGLAEVLAAHVAVLKAGRIKDWTVPVSCECGWVARGETWAHHVAGALAPVVAAHLAVRLSDPDVVEAAASMAHDARYRWTGDDEIDFAYYLARAVLAAAADALGAK